MNTIAKHHVFLQSLLSNWQLLVLALSKCCIVDHVMIAQLFESTSFYGLRGIDLIIGLTRVAADNVPRRQTAEGLQC